MKSRSRAQHLLAAAAVMSAAACGGGRATGPGGNHGPAASIAITPSPLLINSGATATLTAVVKDASGNTLSNAGLRWASATDSIARVSTSGVVTGIVPGTTVVRAQLDSLKAFAIVGVFNPDDLGGRTVDSILATRCNGYGAVQAWTGRVTWQYAAAATSNNITVEVDHHVNMKVQRLPRIVATATLVTWEGVPQEDAPALSDKITDRNPSVAEVTRLRSRGPLVTEDATGRLSWITLNLDLNTCRLDLHANPHVAADVTGPSGDVTPGVFPIGELHEYGLEADSKFFLVEDFSRDIPAHSFLWAASRFDVNVYLPGGFGQQLFTNPSLNEGPEGTVLLNFSLGLPEP